MSGEILDRSACRQSLDELLNSARFKRSPTLRRLLDYLGASALAGEGEKLKEYRIGVEALRKPDDYDPRADPSARVQIGRLRSRLAAYYEHEGRDADVIVTLPKGGFALRFKPRRGGPNVADRSDPSRRRAATAAALSAILTAAMTAAVLWTPDPVASLENGDEFRALWHPYFDSSLPVVVSLGVPVWMRFDGDGEGAVGALHDQDLNNWPAETSSNQSSRLEFWRDQLDPRTVGPPNRRAPVGESIGAFLLGKALVAQGKDPSVVRSNVLSWDSLKGSNIIVIGPPRPDPQLHTIEFSRHFRIGDYFVHNLHPLPGERSTYPDGSAPGGDRTAALFGRYQSPGGGWVTVVESANSAGSWAAVEYVTRPDYVAALNAGLRSLFSRIPDEFEVVIEAEFENAHPIAVRHHAIREASGSLLSFPAPPSPSAIR